jgi:catechol 2,3-dioxygenase-like lactoylglutathione lyase family enzyme
MESNTNQPLALKAHLALNVRNVGASIEFYRKLLGIEPSKVRTGYAKFNVENPPLNLTLNQTHFDNRGALSHLGIQVGSTEDVVKTRDRWKAAGPMQAFNDRTRGFVCGSLQVRVFDAEKEFAAGFPSE